MRKVSNYAFATLLSDFLYKNICCRYSFELPRLVKAIQMSSHKICFYKEVDKSALAVIEILLTCTCTCIIALLRAYKSICGN